MFFPLLIDVLLCLLCVSFSYHHVLNCAHLIDLNLP